MPSSDLINRRRIGGRLCLESRALAALSGWPDAHPFLSLSLSPDTAWDTIEHWHYRHSARALFSLPASPADYANIFFLMQIGPVGSWAYTQRMDVYMQGSRSGRQGALFSRLVERGICIWLKSQQDGFCSNCQQIVFFLGRFEDA